jgi:Calcineurin-like phosphoesterase
MSKLNNLQPELFFPTSKSVINLLQITDDHLFRMGFFDKRYLKQIKSLCVQWNIDLLVHTGDLFGHNQCGVKTVKQILKGMDDIVGTTTPWTYSWGNHDHCLQDKVDTACNFKDIENYLEELPNCYYKATHDYFKSYPRALVEKNQPENNECNQPESIETSATTPSRRFYGGNFVIRIHNSKSNKDLWHLYMLNSAGLNGIPPRVFDWMTNYKQLILEKDTKSTPALAFYHVPNYEFHLIAENEKFQGIMGEKVCHSGENDQNHRNFVELGNIQGGFVGHDHINDYYGIMDKIIYSYGRKSGTHGYGGKKQKENWISEKKFIRSGAKLISLDIQNKKWAFKTVFEDKTSWNECIRNI